MRSSVLELKIKEIAELKPGGLYILRFNGIPDDPTRAYLNQYLQTIYKATGTAFMVLDEGSIRVENPVEGQIQYFENIVEEVLKKHGIIKEKENDL